MPINHYRREDGHAPSLVRLHLHRGNYAVGRTDLVYLPNLHGAAGEQCQAGKGDSHEPQQT
jgi:hypothetical protein